MYKASIFYKKLRPKKENIENEGAKIGEKAKGKTTFAEIVKGNEGTEMINDDTENKNESTTAKHHDNIRIRTQFRRPTEGGSKESKLKK